MHVEQVFFKGFGKTLLINLFMFCTDLLQNCSNYLHDTLESRITCNVKTPASTCCMPSSHVTYSCYCNCSFNSA